MPGLEGPRAAALLREAHRGALDTLTGIAAAAFARLMDDPSPQTALHLFTPDEREQLSEALAGATAAADLLGRARLRELTERAAGPRRFSEGAATFHRFAEPVPAVTPEAALDYFRGLVPTLGVDPERYGEDMRREAFTMAAATEDTLLARTQDILARWMETGATDSGGNPDAAAAVQELLDTAGVSPNSPHYAELVVRTNLSDAYNQGAWDEFNDPDVQDEFPAWKYSNPDDGRSRPTHAARNGRYYPASASFNEVRGTDISQTANCRCSFLPVHKSEWAGLQARGVAFASFSECAPGLSVFCQEGPNAGKPGPCPGEGSGGAGEKHGYTRQEVRGMTPGQRKALARRLGVDTKGVSDEQLTAHLAARAQDTGASKLATQDKPGSPARPAEVPQSQEHGYGLLATRATESQKAAGGVAVEVGVYSRTADARPATSAPPAEIGRLVSEAASGQARAGGQVSIQQAYERVRAANPQVSLDEFHGQLLHWSAEGQIGLLGNNDPRMSSPQELRTSVALPRPGAGPGVNTVHSWILPAPAAKLFAAGGARKYSEGGADRRDP